MTDSLVPRDAFAPVGGVEFRVEYEGPEFEGEMSAVLLAEVLRAMAEYSDALVKATAVNEPAASTLRVRATETGSFDIVAFIVANWGVLSAVLSGGGVSFAFWYKNMRKVVTAFEERDDGTVKVTLASGEVALWTKAEFRLYRDKRAKRALGKILDPVGKGASEIRLTLGNEKPLVLDQRSVEAMRPEIFAEARLERSEVWASPDVVALRSSATWKWDTPSGSFKAKIEDKKFLDDIALGRVKLGPNDRFLLGLRREWVENADGEITDLTTYIERVIDSVAGAEQDELPRGDQDPD